MFEESAHTLAQKIEAKDTDDATRDDMFGETNFSEESLTNLVNQNLKELTADPNNDPSLTAQIKEGAENILDKRRKEVDAVDHATDDQIAALVAQLDTDLRQFADFMSETIQIEGRTPQQLELMSNTEGSITGVDFLVSQENSLLTIVSMDRNMPRNVTFSIITNKPELLTGLIEKHGKGYVTKEGGRKVYLTDTAGIHFTDYVRDGHVKLGGNQIVLPSVFSRGQELEAITQMGQTRSLEVRQEQQLFFQGGNLRATANTLFIGADDITSTSQS